jgi:hypothetical protein
MIQPINTRSRGLVDGGRGVIAARQCKKQDFPHPRPGWLHSLASCRHWLHLTWLSAPSLSRLDTGIALMQLAFGARELSYTIPRTLGWHREASRTNQHVTGEEGCLRSKTRACDSNFQQALRSCNGKVSSAVQARSEEVMQPIRHSSIGLSLVDRFDSFP